MENRSATTDFNFALVGFPSSSQSQMVSCFQMSTAEGVCINDVDGADVVADANDNAGVAGSKQKYNRTLIVKCHVQFTKKEQGRE